MIKKALVALTFLLAIPSFAQSGTVTINFETFTKGFESDTYGHPDLKLQIRIGGIGTGFQATNYTVLKTIKISDLESMSAGQERAMNDRVELSMEEIEAAVESLKGSLYGYEIEINLLESDLLSEDMAYSHTLTGISLDSLLDKKIANFEIDSKVVGQNAQGPKVKGFFEFNP